MAMSSDENQRNASSKLLADLFLLLGNEIRVEVLRQLVDAERTVRELSQELQLEHSTVSHALQRLRKMGLVEHTRSKKWHLYRLSRGVSVSSKGALLRIEVLTRFGKRVAIEAEI